MVKLSLIPELTTLLTLFDFCENVELIEKIVSNIRNC